MFAACYCVCLNSLMMTLLHKPSVSRGHSSQGSPQPSPGILLQQHLALVVLKALGTEHLPASNLVKQKLSLVSGKAEIKSQLCFQRRASTVLAASLTVAAPFVVRQHEARLARALEAARGVGAGPELAEAEIHTLIDILEVSIKERVCMTVCDSLMFKRTLRVLPMHWSFCTS